jgi:hypothetical protein
MVDQMNCTLSVELTMKNQNNHNSLYNLKCIVSKCQKNSINTIVFSSECYQKCSVRSKIMLVQSWILFPYYVLWWPCVLSNIEMIVKGMMSQHSSNNSHGIILKYCMVTLIGKDRWLQDLFSFTAAK